MRAGDVGWAIEVNLSRGPVARANVLAELLAEQARASQVRVDSRLEQLTDTEASLGDSLAVRPRQSPELPAFLDRLKGSAPEPSRE